jgi:hypothetical protein
VTAPRWISEALAASWDGLSMGDVPGFDDIARELLERLPIDAMRAAALTSLDDVAANRPAEQHSAIATTAIVRVLSDGDPEVVELTEIYQGASKALDAAGVPYAVATSDSEGNDCNRELDLASRIRWLAQQRPNRLDLQRVEAERDAWHRRNDECIVTITANQRSIATLIDESEARRRERDYWKELAEATAAVAEAGR